MEFFGIPRSTKVKRAGKKSIPDGLWTKCVDCGQIIYNKSLEENCKVCPKCNYHFLLTPQERVKLLLDEDSFEELAENLTSVDPLEFKGPKTYKDKLKDAVAKTGSKSACIIGKGMLGPQKIILGITDSRFIMGSMGSVVGEKVTRALEAGITEQAPVIIVSGSGGGARMYEGMFSLMQMAKTSAACAKLREAGGVFISILTDPTMAGVMASYASLGDLILAEPRALIGFTGPRVIEQTLRQKLPEGFQRSEFLLEHGLIDMIVDRASMREQLIKILQYLWPQGEKAYAGTPDIANNEKK